MAKSVFSLGSFAKKTHKTEKKTRTEELLENHFISNCMLLSVWWWHYWINALGCIFNISQIIDWTVLWLLHCKITLQYLSAWQDFETPPGLQTYCNQIGKKVIAFTYWISLHAFKASISGLPLWQCKHWRHATVFETYQKSLIFAMFISKKKPLVNRFCPL